MAAADPALSLSTLIPDRPVLRIDGATYHLKSPDELSLVESRQFGKWGKELEALGKDPDQTEALEALLEVVATAALADVPPEVFARLSKTQLLSIAEVFTLLLLGHQARRAGAVASAVRSTGPSTSRVSSIALAATLGGGFTAPRPPSSEPM
jgi:hypothetical protein